MAETARKSKIFVIKILFSIFYSFFYFSATATLQIISLGFKITLVFSRIEQKYFALAQFGFLFNKMLILV